jgi:hypothetical protein
MTSATLESDAGNKISAATTLVAIANRIYEFGVSEAGETFAVPREGPKVVQLLRGGKTSLRSQLARLYFAETAKAAPQQALADALLVLEGAAQDTRPQVLHLRVAHHDDATWLDLGDPSGRAVCITENGWTVEPSAPVLFKRTSLTGILPDPRPGGSLDNLWSLLNVSAEDRPLVAAWLAAVMHPGIPHPILSLAGEQGSGKSTAEKVLVSVLDPSPVPLRKPPRDVENWVTAASGSWVVGIDNISSIQDWFSDALCRAVTGDGDVRRRLYTDGDIQVFSFRRCLILNGIDLGAVRGDLADRLLAVNLSLIPDDRRLTESGMLPRWNAAHGEILGAVLDLVARVARVIPSVDLVMKPRMADFAVVVAAVDQVLGTAGFERFMEKQGELATDSLTADAFVQAIASVDEFIGSAAELFSDIPKPEKLPHGWPVNARAVTKLLRRQAPVMRKAGWHVQDDGARNHRNVAVWTIRPPRFAGISSSQASPDSHGSLAQGSDIVGREDARHARQENGQSQEAQNVYPTDGREHMVSHNRKCRHCRGDGEVLMHYMGDKEVWLHRDCWSSYAERGATNG